MEEYKIVRRTFEAFKHPKGSPDRNRLNKSSLTSEHQRNCIYLVMKNNKPAKVFQTIAECQDLMKNPDKYREKVKPYTAERFNVGAYWYRKRHNYFTSLR